MFKSKYILLLVFLLSYGYSIANDGKYRYKVDLSNVIDDKVFVELILEGFTESELTFSMPKMIPGTYAIEDYGRFIHDFKVLDKKGRELPFERTSTNTWLIPKAKKLSKITYWVEDSYDTTIDGPEIFQPAGTNIEDSVNFIINPSGFFGYIEGSTTNAYEISIIKPSGFYGSTGLIPESINNDLSTSLSLEGVEGKEGALVDIFKTTSYDELVDSPLMYCLPDTTVIDVAGTEVLVSTYSPNKVINSQEIASTLEEVLMAQKEYLGGQLPVDKYAFIFYFTDQPVMEYGALEHSYSSFYYMPEYSIEELSQQLNDIAAHEFFHIVTPLSIHSEQINPFNFSNPEMSRHLWLYEGVTEYFAGNAQVKGGVISIDQYIASLRDKLFIAEDYDAALPFTELSLGALDRYADQYYNVYQKGALIGLALDLNLLELSDAEYGLQQLVGDLSKEYGKEKSFKDDELFDKITELTYPEVRNFFTTYVEGNTPLDYADIFAKAGIIYEKKGVFFDYTFGLTESNLGVDMERGVFFVQNADELNDFGKSLGYQEGDVITGFNETAIPELGPAVMQYFQDVMISMVEGEEFKVTVLRQTENGDEEEVLLTAPIIKSQRVVPHAIRPDPNATEDQIKVRIVWLGLEENTPAK